jgi:hypothetical protein
MEQKNQFATTTKAFFLLHCRVAGARSRYLVSMAAFVHMAETFPFIMIL